MVLWNLFPTLHLAITDWPNSLELVVEDVICQKLFAGMGCAPAFQLSLQVLAESSMLDVTLCDVLLMLPAGAFEVHHIKLQVTTQLGVGEHADLLRRCELSHGCVCP